MIEYKDLLGVPYKRGGKDRSGIDCYALCQEVSNRAGIELPDFNSPSEDSILKQVVIQGKELFTRLDKPIPYCIVAFYVKGFVSHTGIVLEDCKKFIHILNNKVGVTVEKLDNPTWSKRIEGYYWFNKE